jgi:hypothetical protein
VKVWKLATAPLTCGRCEGHQTIRPGDPYLEVSGQGDTSDRWVLRRCRDHAGSPPPAVIEAPPPRKARTVHGFTGTHDLAATAVRDYKLEQAGDTGE